jgi:hypothetical protein
MPATPHSACGVMSPELRLPRNVQTGRGAINVAAYQVDNTPPLPSSVCCATESVGVLSAWLMSSHGRPCVWRGPKPRQISLCP